MTIQSTTPRWVMPVAFLFLLWNLMGVWSFAANWQMSANGYAGLPDAQRELWSAMPAWTWVAFGIAVGGGTAGAIALLARSRIAVPLFLISFVAILIQFSWPIFMTDAWSKMRMELITFPIILALVALVEWLLSMNWRARGWLK
jgi:hypothetical protein